MPIATPDKYAEMLDTAKSKSFAFPAINVSSSQTLNAALQGFADAGSDGIIQVSTGGADYLSGPSIKNMVSGSVAWTTVRDGLTLLPSCPYAASWLRKHTEAAAMVEIDWTPPPGSADA